MIGMRRTIACFAALIAGRGSRCAPLTNIVRTWTEMYAGRGLFNE